jgi:hypothetical protein
MTSAEDPATNKLYAYREYKAGGRTAAEHAAHIKQGEPPFATVVGGSKSEGQWRQEFTAGGLAVREPDQPEVEVGIDRVYGAIKSGKLFVFNTQMDGLLEELGTYSRKVPARILPLQLTGSAVKAELDGRGGWTVPKVELTSLMQVLLAGRRPEDAQSALFAVADGMGETAALLHAEWQSFTSRVQLTVSKDTSLVWRETANEDLCLAIACGCWVAESCQRRLVCGF